MSPVATLSATLMPDEVGSKAATLGVLRDQGFPVPPGVVVLGDAEATSEALRAFLSQHAGDGFAVRSSGVDEDGTDSSMAGRYRSYLGVTVTDVAQRIGDCRRHADQSRGNGFGPIPVLVQRLIPAEIAGVAFTADPVTGARDVTVVTATRGLGDALMSGEESGEEWVVKGRRASRRRRNGNVASRRLIRRVAAIAENVAARLGSPQDVEWAFDGRQVWVVQSRPITGLPPDVSWDIDIRGVFHRGFRFGEWISEPVTPLFESWLLTTMERRMHEIHRQLIGQLARPPLHLVVNGWYFYSLNFLPVPGASLLPSLPRVLKLAATTPRRVAVMFPQTVTRGYQLYEDDWRADLEPRYQLAVSEAEQRIEAASTAELVHMVDELATLAGEYFASIAVVAGSGYKVETLLGQFWNRHLRTPIGISHMELLGGLHGTNTSGPLLASLDWYIDPIVEPRVHSGPNDVEARRLEAEQRARALLAGSPRRLRRFEELLRHAQHLQPVREEQMAGLARAWPVMRRAVVRTGESLVLDDVIDGAEDAFFLTRYELAEVLPAPRSLRDEVRKRRAARDEAKTLVPPAMVGRMPLMTRFAFLATNRAVGAQEIDGALVSGVPASPGTASGPVRIVRDAADLSRVRPGDVIVSPVTAPAWTPAFGIAAALVTDVGSGLAHGSIMAREYGIPAVVGCGDATVRLTEDQVVTVDGLTGAVLAGDGPPSVRSV